MEDCLPSLQTCKHNKGISSDLGVEYQLYETMGLLLHAKFHVMLQILIQDGSLEVFGPWATQKVGALFIIMHK